MAKNSNLTNHVSEPYRSLREDIYYSQYGVTKVPSQPKSSSDKPKKKKRQVKNIVLLFLIFIFKQTKKIFQGAARP
jgi:hypothetical protein